MDTKFVLVMKGFIAVALLVLTASILFVPVVEGAQDVKSMVILLTGIAVRDFFGAAQEDKRVESLKQAYDPTPPESFVDREDA